MSADAIASLAVRRAMMPEQSLWPDPEPLVHEAETGRSYPIDALPAVLREAALAYHAYGQQPLPMIACSILAAASLATQGLADVARDEHLIGPISLNIAVIAASGERKTSADRRLSRSAREWAQGKRDSLQPEVDTARAKVAAHQAERDGLLAKIKAQAGRSEKAESADLAKLKADLALIEQHAPTEPITPSLFYEDVSPEALAQFMAFGWPSASLWSDEAGLVIGGRGMAEESLMRFLGLLNRFWDGLPFERHRTTAKSFVVKGRRLTSCLMMQPGVLAKLLTAGDGISRGSGFLARFLVAWPVSTMGTRLYRGPGENGAIARYDECLTALLDRPLPAQGTEMALSPPVLFLSTEAHAIWREYHNDVECSLGATGDYGDVADFAAKSADNAARLAAIFHLIQHGGPEGQISQDTMLSAVRVAIWHLHEAKRVVGAAAVPQALADAKTLLAWIQAREAASVPLRTILNQGPHQLRDRRRRDGAVERLVESGHVRTEKDSGVSCLILHPSLTKRAA